MGMNYNPRDRTTKVFFGYNLCAGFSNEVLENLEHIASRISEPLLLPFLVHEQLAYQLQDDIINATYELNIFNLNQDLFDIFINKRPIDTSGNEKAIPTFDTVHKLIVNHHAILTNAFGPFLASFGVSLERAISKLEDHFNGKGNGGLVSRYNSFHSRQCLDVMATRSGYWLLRRDQLLSKIDIYLQMIHNFMQQDIARDTKRDSSAMKSLSLLTMVFLPATAIATIMAPFTKISDNDQVKVTNQFWVFWAAAGPVTLVVIITWILWIQRAEVQKTLTAKIEQLKNMEMLQRRTKMGDTESRSDISPVI
ncbi:hypothetical protein QBC43DRAFT_204488 [Cladorrhinum sp. PSN259]|nr:hypothetical protein QBC43DRAFT_204488 [Cladorrhinum sp. PSN259]